ncbi:MAG: FIST C-terminal domain-containing protein [Coriobacteriales bacterium]|jgi:hypothetical protein|nr:FIST C-terminal domain-containing protein [Coriobacteriales bacterium]
MIEVRTARTNEIDETGAAVDQIIQTIDPTTLRAHSAGILFCHFDYVESGVIEALHKALGFDIIGMTSTSNATQSGFDMYGLSLAVLTSDDVHFEAAMTTALTRDTFAAEIESTYQTTQKALGAAPALSFTLIPYMEAISAAEMVRVYNDSCGGKPFWGSVTTSVELFFDQCFTVFNERIIEDGFAMLLLAGDVQPEFICNSIPNQLISGRRALVTKSRDYRIYEIDDKPAVDFLNSFDLNVSPTSLPVNNPMLVYYKNSPNPVALGIYTIFEDGSLLLGGPISDGDTVTVGNMTREGIFQTTEECLERIQSMQEPRGVLILPCVTRFYFLSPTMNDELELVRERLGVGEVPYLMGYSGGEICPVKDESGQLVNRLHNYTIAACVL